MKFVEKSKHKFHVQNSLPPTENRVFYEIMLENVVEVGRTQMTIWRMRLKATNTHLEYVIHIAFPLQQWLHERASLLRYSIVRFLCLKSIAGYIQP
jgi:hypothetical protein